MRSAGLCLIALLSGCGGEKEAGAGGGSAAVASGSAEPAKPAGTTVVVNGGKVTINGSEIGAKPMMADIEKVLGKPDRTSDLPNAANKIYTWDSLGVVAYDPKDGRCISTTFPYKPMGSEFSPKNMFKGTITVDGNPIPVGTEISDLKTRKDATQPYGADSLVFDKGEIHVFTTQKASGIDLVEVSYWQKPKPKAALFAGSYKTSEGPMTLKQKALNPNDVSGTYSKGRIICTALGDELDCKWIEPGSQGRAHFKRDASGNMTGTWGGGNASTGGGTWTCTLLTAGTME